MGLGALVLAIASLWLAIAIHGVATGEPAVVPGLGSSGAYWAGALGAALAVLGLHWSVRRQTVVVDGAALVVTERSLLGRHRWREALANYREIRGRVEERPHRYGRRSWHVVEIWHAEPARRIELVRDRDRAAAEADACDHARRLGLPLVWEQPRSVAVAPAEVHAADPSVARGPSRDIAATALSGRSLSAG